MKFCLQTLFDSEIDMFSERGDNQNQTKMEEDAK